MNQITQVTADPSQSQTFILGDGTSFSYTMQFVPMQLGWYFYNITYGNFQINGMRITVNTNILFQFQNIIPFGIACLTATSREPMLQQDFSSGAFKLYVLNQVDCKQYTQFLSGVPAWNPLVTYAINFLVSYDGSLYESLTANNIGNLPTNSAYWGAV